MTAEQTKLTIRIPSGLHSDLVALAKDDARSLNAEIVVLLKEAIERRSKKPRR